MKKRRQPWLLLFGLGVLAGCTSEESDSGPPVQPIPPLPCRNKTGRGRGTHGQAGPDRHGRYENPGQQPRRRQGLVRSQAWRARSQTQAQATARP